MDPVRQEHPRGFLAQTDPSPARLPPCTPCLFPLSPGRPGPSPHTTNPNQRHLPHNQSPAHKETAQPRRSQGPRTSWLQILENNNKSSPEQNSAVLEPAQAQRLRESLRKVSWKEPGPAVSRTVGGISERMAAGSGGWAGDGGDPWGQRPLEPELSGAGGGFSQGSGSNWGRRSGKGTPA